MHFILFIFISVTLNIMGVGNDEKTLVFSGRVDSTNDQINGYWETKCVNNDIECKTYFIRTKQPFYKDSIEIWKKNQLIYINKNGKSLDDFTVIISSQQLGTR